MCLTTHRQHIKRGRQDEIYKRKCMRLRKLLRSGEQWKQIFQRTGLELHYVVQRVPRKILKNQKYKKQNTPLWQATGKHTNTQTKTQTQTKQAQKNTRARQKNIRKYTTQRHTHNHINIQKNLNTKTHTRSHINIKKAQRCMLKSQRNCRAYQGTSWWRERGARFSVSMKETRKRRQIKPPQYKFRKVLAESGRTAIWWLLAQSELYLFILTPATRLRHRKQILWVLQLPSVNSYTLMHWKRDSHGKVFLSDFYCYHKKRIWKLSNA